MADVERIDKWLWAMRVFKTRSIATEACKKGRVMMAGSAAKPSKMIKPGDVIDVKKPPVTYTFNVLKLANNRLGAKLVPEYLENITPASQYEILEMAKISGFVDRRKGLGRPTKKESRDLNRFAETTYADTFFMDFEDDDDDIEIEDDFEESDS